MRKPAVIAAVLLLAGSIPALADCKLCPDTGDRECGPRACERPAETPICVADCPPPRTPGTIWYKVGDEQYVLITQNGTMLIEPSALGAVLATVDQPLTPAIVLPGTELGPAEAENARLGVEAFNKAVEEARSSLVHGHSVDIGQWGYDTYIDTYRDALIELYREPGQK